MSDDLPRECGPFGELLRRCRAGAHLTQEALAERSGLSVHAVSMLERGVRRAPRAITVERLARALELDAKQTDLLVALARGRPAPGSEAGDHRAGDPPEPRAGVPPDPIPCFVGREDELAELRTRLQRAGRVAIHGLGGVGKTQLALQYLHSQQAAYPDGLFWLRAEAESSLLSDLAGVAWRLSLPASEPPHHERQVAAVLRWLRLHPRWLLVLDNLEPIARDAVDRWLPPGLPGHLLATSRTPTWSARLRLGPLPPDAARRYLIERTGEEDAEAAEAIAAMLGQLPLALAQAAAYLEASGRDLASYQQLLRTRLVELMAEAGPEEYERTVATTWQVSFERLESERPGAAALLRLCAFLAPDDIPTGLLQAGAGGLPGELREAVSDDLELDRTIAALRCYSLAERDGDRLRVHRLVQAMVRDSMGPDQRRQWLPAVVRLLQGSFPDEPEAHPESWTVCGRLLPHAELVAVLADGNVGEPLGQVLQRAGTYAWARGRLDLARSLLERALAIRQRELGPDHPDTARTLNGLAYVLHGQGKVAAARSLLERVLAVRERTLDRGHATAESLNDLALVLYGEGELADSRSLLERAVAISESAVGIEHHLTITILTNLGVVLQDQGELAASRSLLERALAVAERVHGPDHLSVGRCMRNLTLTLHAQGERAAADALFERALAIHERVLGPDHPETARTLQRRAAGLRSEGDLAAARACLERALGIYEQAVPASNPMLVQSRRVLDELRTAQQGCG